MGKISGVPGFGVKGQRVNFANNNTELLIIFLKKISMKTVVWRILEFSRARKVGDKNLEVSSIPMRVKALDQQGTEFG